MKNRSTDTTQPNVRANPPARKGRVGKFFKYLLIVNPLSCAFGLILLGFVALNISIPAAAQSPEIPFRITPDGNVGIGTDTPGGLLGLKNNLVHLDVDGNNNLTFTDANNAAVTLSDLMKGKGVIVNEPNDGSSSLWSKGDNSVIYYKDGNVGIGTSTPAAQLDVYTVSALGQNRGNNVLISRFHGVSANNFMNNLWLYRHANGTDWHTTRLHDAISVDRSFLTPGTDTKTWWERDPNNNIQSWGTGSQTYLTVNAGNVGIGTISTSGYKLNVHGTAAKSDGSSSWSYSSDARFKNIFGPYNKGLDYISQLRPVEFRYKEGNSRKLPSDKNYVGFIAQEVQSIFPEAVSTGDDGYLDFNMHAINVAVINALRELHAENQEKGNAIAELQAQNLALQAAVCDLNPEADICL